MTLIPAYGRDYKSKAAAEADFLGGKDFIIADLGYHTYCNVDDLRADGKREVTIRYGKLRKVTVVRF